MFHLIEFHWSSESPEIQLKRHSMMWEAVTGKEGWGRQREQRKAQGRGGWGRWREQREAVKCKLEEAVVKCWFVCSVSYCIEFDCWAKFWRFCHVFGGPGYLFNVPPIKGRRDVSTDPFILTCFDGNLALWLSTKRVLFWCYRSPSNKENRENTARERRGQRGQRGGSS